VLKKAAPLILHVRKLKPADRMSHLHTGRSGLLDLRVIFVILAGLLGYGCAAAPPERASPAEYSLCYGIDQNGAQEMAKEWLDRELEGRYYVLNWALYREGEYTITYPDGNDYKTAGCLLSCWVRPLPVLSERRDDMLFQFLFQHGSLVSAKDITPEKIILF
jgi:hypothetical protein